MTTIENSSNTPSTLIREEITRDRVYREAYDEKGETREKN